MAIAYGRCACVYRTETTTNIFHIVFDAVHEHPQQHIEDFRAKEKTETSAVK